MNNKNVVFFQSNGYLLTKRWAAKEELNILNEETNPDKFILSQQGHMYPENPNNPDSPVRLVENFADSSKAFVTLNDRLSLYVGSLLGESVNLFKDKIVYKPAQSKGYQAHRDGYFKWTNDQDNICPGWYVYAEQFVNSALFLDSATPENGCIELSPAPIVEQTTQRDIENHLKDDLDGYNYIKVKANPGDLLIFHASVLHRSGHNNTDSGRKVVYFTYNLASEGTHRNQYFEDKARSLGDKDAHEIDKALNKLSRSG